MEYFSKLTLPRQFCAGQWHEGKTFLSHRKTVDPQGQYGDRAAKILLTLCYHEAPLCLQELLVQNGWEDTPNMRRAISGILTRLMKAKKITRPMRGHYAFAAPSQEGGDTTEGKIQMGSLLDFSKAVTSAGLMQMFQNDEGIKGATHA